MGKVIENNCSIHGTKKLHVENKKRLGIRSHPHPPSSPVLNAIEKVWRIIKQRIKLRKCFLGTIKELKQAVQEEWGKLVPADWNKYIDRLPEVYAQCTQRKGLQT